MSTKKYDLSESKFHQRLYALIQDDIPAWAKNFGVSGSTIRDSWLRKLAWPSVGVLIRICETTGKSADWLLFGDDYPETLRQKRNAADESSPGHTRQYIDMLESHIKRMETQFDRITSLVGPGADSQPEK